MDCLLLWLVPFHTFVSWIDRPGEQSGNALHKTQSVYIMSTCTSPQLHLRVGDISCTGSYPGRWPGWRRLLCLSSSVRVPSMHGKKRKRPKSAAQKCMNCNWRFDRWMPVWVTLRRARADFLGLNDKCDPEKLLTEAFAFLLSTMQYLHIHGNLAPLQQQRSPPYVLDGLHILVSYHLISLAQGARIPFDVSYCLSGLRRADAVLSAISGGGVLVSIISPRETTEESLQAF